MVFKNIVVLTGAGISAESGVKTFRDHNGLWENHSIEDVATPEGFSRNPQLVYRFYNQRRSQLKEVHPNPGHFALQKLEMNFPGNFTLITQNVDNLHEKAGSRNIIHMHGELSKGRCLHCENVFETYEDFDSTHSCEKCQKIGGLRPHIVWFGEMPFFMDKIHELLQDCDLFMSIGTSGVVYPAAMFVQFCPKNCHKIEFNIDKTDISPFFDEHIIGPSGNELPKWIEKNISF